MTGPASKVSLRGFVQILRRPQDLRKDAFRIDNFFAFTRPAISGINESKQPKGENLVN
jgi:hypothetical protein